jgi:hypothetical protein
MKRIRGCDKVVSSILGPVRIVGRLTGERHDWMNDVGKSTLVVGVIIPPSFRQVPRKGQSSNLVLRYEPSNRARRRERYHIPSRQDPKKVAEETKERKMLELEEEAIIVRRGQGKGS